LIQSIKDGEISGVTIRDAKNTDSRRKERNPVMGEEKKTRMLMQRRKGFLRLSKQILGGEFLEVVARHRVGKSTRGLENADNTIA